MIENLDIKLFNPLPKFYFGNEKHLLVQGFVNNLDRFKNCNLYINEKQMAVTKPDVHYNKTKQKVCANVFQFMVALPNFENQSFVNIVLKFLINNKERKVTLAAIPIKKTLEKFDTEEAEMVAICMPLYQPNLQLFQQQLQSILKQSYQKIKIFIQDDDSSPTIFKEIETYIKAFQNVYLFRNEENIGFYKNVELLLNKVGDSFGYVALSDQDDVWELDKIEQQVAFLKQQKADLCYTDLKIVDVDRNILQPSFWLGRSNHLQNAFALNLQNVATGATMLFKQSVLKQVLPFPQHTGKVYHDHYICAQLQNNVQHKVVYLNKPLINYVQHGNNVTGFSKYKVEKFWHKIFGDIAFIKLFWQLVFLQDLIKYEPLILAASKYYYIKFVRVKLFLLPQQKLSHQQFFSNWVTIKVALQTFFLSYTRYFSNLKLNQFDAVAYKKIGIQLALKLRHLRYKQ